MCFATQIMFKSNSQGWQELIVKIFVLNVTDNHPSYKILSRFGETEAVDTWPVKDRKRTEPSLVFASVSSEDDYKALCRTCDQTGDWCFIWGNDEVLKAIANYPSASLVDFVGENFNEQEFTIRLLRLVQNNHKLNTSNFLGVPEEIAEELTKKQLVILKALFDAGEVGLSKQNLAFKIWPKGASRSAKASGFNVHLLHLRKKLSDFGLTVHFDKEDRVYRLKAQASSVRAKSKANSVPLSISH